MRSAPRFRAWQQVVDAPSPAVADVIRSGGLANTKAPRIQAILREVREREGAYSLDRLRQLSDEDARAYLTSLPGIGPKTAAVVLSFALGRDAMPVDTHVHRVRSGSGSPADGVRRARRPAAARPHPRRPPDAPARRVHPVGKADLQGADTALRRVPAEGPVPDRAALSPRPRSAARVTLYTGSSSTARIHRCASMTRIRFVSRV